MTQYAPQCLNSLLMLPDLGRMKIFITYSGLATKSHQTKPKHSMKRKTMLIFLSLLRKVITEDLVPTGTQARDLHFKV